MTDPGLPPTWLPREGLLQAQRKGASPTSGVFGGDDLQHRRGRGHLPDGARLSESLTGSVGTRVPSKCWGGSSSRSRAPFSLPVQLSWAAISFLAASSRQSAARRGVPAARLRSWRSWPGAQRLWRRSGSPLLTPLSCLGRLRVVPPPPGTGVIGTATSPAIRPDVGFSPHKPSLALDHGS